MHELSLSSAIVNTVAKHAGGQTVSVVKLRVGALRQVVPDSLAFYFELVARATVCEGARLEQTVISGRMRCGCGHEWSLDTPSFRCPRCGAGDASVTAGEEFEVESIIIEEEQKKRSSRRSRALPDGVANATAESEATQEGVATGGKQKSASSSAGS